MLGIALYWAEGSKTDSTSGFVFVTSDPVMIKLMFEWLVRIAKISKNDMLPVVLINNIHQSREKVVLKFWSNLLELPISQFGKVYYVKVSNKKVHDNFDTYCGVMHLKVRKSANLKYKILGLISSVKKQILPG